MIDAGQLDRELTIQTANEVADGVGQNVATWTDVATIPAQRLQLRADDIQRSLGRAPESLVKYRVRWRYGLAPGLRMIEGGVTYLITAVDAPDRRQTLLLTGEEAQ